MTLSVVYVPGTGHVLGALGTTGVPAPTDVGALVGSALPLRVILEAGETATLAVRARELLVLAADDEPGVFADPLAFGVDQVDGPDQTVVTKPALLRLAPWFTGFTLDDIGLTVTVPLPDPVGETFVVAFVSDGADTQVRTGAIRQGDTTVTLPVTVNDGPHGVLVLVAGWAGRLESVTKS